jgi:hypothetical protein
MNAFLKTSSGRLLVLAISLFLLGGAAAVLGEPAATMVFALSFPVAIAIGVVALFTGTTESLGSVMLAAILLPLALFIYAPVVFVIGVYMPSAGYLVIALGLGALGIALRPTAGAETGASTGTSEITKVGAAS